MIKEFLDGGNHNPSESRVILNYMITYLNIAYNDENLELDYQRIEHAYKSGIVFVKLMK